MPTPTTKALDLVFTMDCTGSMGSYISAAKRGIRRITERLAQAEGYDVRYGLVAYRDHPPQDMTFVTKSFGFTSSLEVMEGHLSSLSAQGGGDGPEAVAAALQATCVAEWRPEATKVVVLIADAPPHGLGERGDGFPNGDPDGVDPLCVLDAMSVKGVTVYAVGCQPALSHYRFATEFFLACAEKTNGQAVALGSADGLADVILGASVEEMDLERITQQVVEKMKEVSVSQPHLSDKEREEVVYRSLSAETTRQLQGTRLTSEYTWCLSRAPSLALGKESLEAHGPTDKERLERLERVEKRERMEGECKPSHRISSSSSLRYRSLSVTPYSRSPSPTFRSLDPPDVAPPAAVAPPAETPLSKDQYERLLNRAKKMGRV